MKRTLALSTTVSVAAACSVAGFLMSGCTEPAPPPAVMAPPISVPPPAQQTLENGGVFQWQDVPAGQQVPINRAVFDQGGYQLYAQTGETILVPFANQNLYVMKFGLSDTGRMYFVQDGSVPTLFVPRGTGIENASAQGARWYPFSQDYQYQRPVYVGIAPSWNQFTGMGWYPGMSYYGGYWGYNPYGFSPMTGIVFNIGGHPYYGWNSYSSYYRSNPSYTRVTRTYNYASTGRQAAGSFGRNRGTGSFGSAGGGRSGGGYSSSRPSYNGGTGSFGSRRSGSGGFSSAPPSSGSSGSFGRSSGSSSNNTFGTAANRPAFGSGGSSGTSSSSGSSGYSPFGRRSSGSGSFGSGSSSGSSGYRPFGGSSRPSGGGSFGGGSFGRSSSSSGGGFGRSSGGSFGRSSGGGFGGRRR